MCLSLIVWICVGSVGYRMRDAHARDYPDHLLLRKADVRLPGKGNNSHGARPVHQILMMIQWIRTSKLAMKDFLSPPAS